MKKIISAICLLTLIICVFSSCASTPEYLSCEYDFSRIAGVSLKEDLEDYILEFLYEDYGVTDVETICEMAFDEFSEDPIFENCYLRFEGDILRYYDVIMERDASYAFYETSPNEGFLSVYTDLDVSQGNPDPNTNPPYVYNEETGTFTMYLGYASFVLAVEYVAK